jgi:hypothetical protein
VPQGGATPSLAAVIRARSAPPPDLGARLLSEFADHDEVVTELERRFRGSTGRPITNRAAPVAIPPGPGGQVTVLGWRLSLPAQPVARVRIAPGVALGIDFEAGDAVVQKTAPLSSAELRALDRSRHELRQVRTVRALYGLRVDLERRVGLLGSGPGERRPLRGGGTAIRFGPDSSGRTLIRLQRASEVAVLIDLRGWPGEDVERLLGGLHEEVRPGVDADERLQAAAAVLENPGDEGVVRRWLRTADPDPLLSAVALGGPESDTASTRLARTVRALRSPAPAWVERLAR